MHRQPETNIPHQLQSWGHNYDSDTHSCQGHFSGVKKKNTSVVVVCSGIMSLSTIFQS